MVQCLKDIGLGKAALVVEEEARTSGFHLSTTSSSGSSGSSGTTAAVVNGSEVVAKLIKVSCCRYFYVPITYYMCSERKEEEYE